MLSSIFRMLTEVQKEQRSSTRKLELLAQDVGSLKRKWEKKDTDLSQTGSEKATHILIGPSRISIMPKLRCRCQHFGRSGDMPGSKRPICYPQYVFWTNTMHKPHMPDVFICHPRRLHLPHSRLFSSTTIPFDICQRSCSKANFVWNLAQKLFARELLRKQENIQALSPRRRHAIEHSVCEVYGISDGNIRETVQGFNAGLRKLRYRQPLSLVSLDLNA